MAILDDLKSAANAGLSAGVTAARGQGTALSNDFDVLIKPNLDAIVAEIAAIAEDRVAGTIGDDQAKSDLTTQLSRVGDLILAVTELALLAVEVIINAVVNALKAAVNGALKFPLL